MAGGGVLFSFSLATLVIAATGSGLQELNSAHLAVEKQDFKRANQFYRRALLAPDAYDAATIGLAQLLIQQNEVAEAEELLQTYLKDTNPFQLDVRLTLVDALIKKFDLKNAERELVKVEHLRPHYLAVREKRAVIAYHKKNYSEAIRISTSCLKESPALIGSRILRGESYLRTNQPALAAQDLKLAVDERPTDISLHLLLADALGQIGREEESEKVILFVLKLKADSDLALGGLARIYAKMGRRNDAAVYYRKAVLANPLQGEYGLELANLHVLMNQPLKAEEELLRVFHTMPDFSPAAERLVALYTQNLQIDKAGKFLKEYTGRMPERTWAAVAFAKLLLELGQADAAEIAVRRNLKEDIAGPEGFVFLAGLKNAQDHNLKLEYNL